MSKAHHVTEPAPDRLARSDRFDPEALGTLGRGLTTGAPAPGHREVTLERLLADGLEEELAAYARALGDVDRMLAGASWSKTVTTLVLPGVIGAWTLADVGLDASPGNLALHVEDDRPRRVRVRDPARLAPVSDRDRALATLFGDSLEPLFEAITRSTGLPIETHWSNVGNLLAFLYDELERRGIAVEGTAGDRQRLLEEASAAWRAGPNPIEGTVRYTRFEAEGLPERYQVRQRCCLKRQLPGKQACTSCPAISPSQRRAQLEHRESST